MLSEDRLVECEEYGAEWEAEGACPEGAARKMVSDLANEVRRLKNDCQYHTEQAVQASVEAWGMLEELDQLRRENASLLRQLREEHGAAGTGPSISPAPPASTA